jgi:polyisoprenoid-binding protein YceI
MKRLSFLHLTSILALSAGFALPAAAAETYTLDPTHTAITWNIDHFGFSSPSGKFMNVDGTLVLDQEHPDQSKVEVKIPVADVNTGVPKLDEHLKTKEFFDVAAFPEAVFVSDKVEVTGEKTALVHGNLTLHGVTKPVTLNVTLNKLAENMFKKQTAGFTASTTIKRSDFGMTTYLPALGDDIQIAIESEANLAEAAAPAANKAAQ